MTLNDWTGVILTTVAERHARMMFFIFLAYLILIAVIYVATHLPKKDEPPREQTNEEEGSDP
jgi:hypothetical protein